MADGATRLRKGRKFDQVLEGARGVFLLNGFEGASVDDIARAAGVSKATLYSYFPDKRLLFIEVARTECCRQADIALATLDMAAPIPRLLEDIATQMVRFVTSEFGLGMFRIFVAESARFPELARDFYESGPMLVRDRLAQILQMAVDRGELVIDDVMLAADQFAELCKADLFPKLVFNIRTATTEADRQRIAKGAVAMFMARYGS